MTYRSEEGDMSDDTYFSPEILAAMRRMLENLSRTPEGLEEIRKILRSHSKQEGADETGEQVRSPS